ncbi:MAG: ABC transporter ATP-binding protein [Candidatus Asgardarchaeia archaeon]
MTEYAVEIKDFYWKYEGNEDWILKNINLKIKKGEFVVITGPTGAGKTTLLMTLNGLIPHSRKGYYKGDVYVNGIDTAKSTVNELSAIAGMVFQDPESQFVTMSVIDEIVFGAENLAVPVDEIARRVDKVLEITKLKGFEDKAPYELSGGQKQRVAIASVLAMEPQILVLDEPTSELDPIGRLSVLEVVSKLKENMDFTIIMVEHNVEEYVKYADRVILLYEGEILIDAPPREFFKDVDFILSKGAWVPQVTEFAYRLYKKGLLDDCCPLYTEEGIEIVDKLLQKMKPVQVQESIPLNKGNNEKKKLRIEVKDLHFSYPDGTQALKGVNFKVYDGEFIAIIGENGSGKTTLVKHFNGLFKPTKGDVIVDGKNTKKTTVFELARTVGYVFQNPDHQIAKNTVLEEVAFSAINFGIPREEAEARAIELLKTFGLEDKLEEQPFFLSKAERQRVAISSILCWSPDIVIVDEPTTGQDMRQSYEIMEVLKKVHEMGKTVIIITHNINLVCEYADRVAVMHDGNILIDGTPEHVFSYPELIRKTAIKPPQINEIASHFTDRGIPKGIFTVKQLVDIFVEYQ